MVLLTTTPRILSAISSLSPSDRAKLASDSLPASCETPIDHKTLVALARASNAIPLHTLLRGTQVYVPPPPPKPAPSPEYVALMDRLRREQEKREYASLMSKQTSSGTDEGEGDDGQDDISPSLVFNILLSIVMCTGAMFHMTRWWANDGLRVLVSLLAGIVVGVAEVTVYASYLRKVRVSREKERAKREKKQVIGEYRGEPVADMDVTSKETEHIWGRGINGGMRRRVREKWEKEQKQS